MIPVLTVLIPDMKPSGARQASRLFEGHVLGCEPVSSGGSTFEAGVKVSI